MINLTTQINILIEKMHNFRASIKKIFKSFTIYTGATFLGQAITFLLLPVLTRFLSPKDYGSLAIFTAMMGITNMLISLGGPSAVLRVYFDREKKGFNFPEYIANAFFVSTASFLSLSAIILFSGSFIAQQLRIEMNWLFALPVIGICAVAYNIYAKLFVLEKKPVPYAIARTSNTLIEIMLTLFFVVVIGLNWRGRIMSMVITKVIFLIISVCFLLKKRLLRFTINIEYIKDILRYGIPIVFHSLGFVIVTSIDRFYITKFVGLSTTGIYSVSCSICAIITIFVGAFTLAWDPFFYENMNKATDAFRVKLVKYTYLYFAMILSGVFLFILVVPHVLGIIVGKNFLGARLYIFWLALGFGFHGMYTMVVSYIFYVKKTYILGRIALVTICLSVILNFVMVNINGAIGVAQATCLVFLSRFLMVWYFANKVYPMPWFSFAVRKNT